MKTMFSVVFIFLLLLTDFSLAEKTAALPELTNPSAFAHPIHVDDNNIYVVDGIKVFIYSAKTHQLNTVFGKPGEGPGEFIGSDGGQNVSATIDRDHIVVSSVGRLSYFTKGGQFVREIKTANGFIFIPFGDNFIGNKFIVEDHKEFAGLYFFDPEFNTVKQLAKTSQFSMRAPFSPFFVYRARPVVYQNKLYVNHPDTGMIDVYDQQAKKLASFTHDFEKISISEADKKTIMSFYETDLRVKEYYQVIKTLITFPTYFPRIKTYHVSDNKLYVLTYKRRSGDSEFVILDLQGNLIKKVMFPLSHVGFLETCPYTIFNGKVYQLVFNEDLDEWELHIDELK